MKEKRKIGIIGSGLSGLSIGYLLTQSHHFLDSENVPEVHLFERSKEIGMDAASVSILDGKVRVDVPMRGFYVGYYPSLVKLYQTIGIRFGRRNHSMGFCRFNEAGQELAPFFTYKNILEETLGYGLPFPVFKLSNLPEILRLSYDWVRFIYQSHKYVHYLKNPKIKPPFVLKEGQTIQEYFVENKYSEVFTRDSFYPVMSALATCPYSDCEAYPAKTVLEFFGCGIIFEGTSVALDGVRTVCKVLSKDISNVHLNTPIVSVDNVEVNGKLKVMIVDGNGHERVFDEVIIASLANQALTMLKNPSNEEKACLASFKYVKSRVIVHTDERVMPKDKDSWRGIVFASSPNHDMPMATMYMNASMNSLQGEKDIFQTWNPITQPRPETILSESGFERPVVNQKSIEGLSKLSQIQGKRNIYFVGAYAYPGVPLLEGCVCSGLEIAQKLGVDQEKVFRKDLGQVRTYKESLVGHIMSLVLFIFGWFLDLLLM